MPTATCEHWDSYYDGCCSAPTEPSSFARYVLERLRGRSLLDVGCGNGRDSLFFAHHGITTVAMDRCERAVSRLTCPPLSQVIVQNAGDKPGDRSGERQLQISVDAVYMRFFLHAVDETEASRVLDWCAELLPSTGQIFIEARSVRSSLYGVGEQVGRDAFVCGHYRRFIRADEIQAELQKRGFTINICCETAGVAIFNNDDPVVVRVVASKASM
eukprot:ANDGO_02146.mRNA.1 hypothetical protein